MANIIHIINSFNSFRCFYSRIWLLILQTMTFFGLFKPFWDLWASRDDDITDELHLGFFCLGEFCNTVLL